MEVQNCQPREGLTDGGDHLRIEDELVSRESRDIVLKNIEQICTERVRQGMDMLAMGE